MIRTVLAVLAGVLNWGLLSWIGYACLLAAFPDGFTDADAPMPESTTVLAIMVALTPTYSTASGFLAARIASTHRWRAVLILTGVNVAIGLWAEISRWSEIPAWYHLTLLILLIPFHLAGGRLGGAKPGD